jgi:hypothetical protein
MVDKEKTANAMKLLLVLLVSMMSIDGIVTYWAVTNELARESNNIVAPIAGDWQFILLKVVGAIVSALVLWNVYKHFPRIALLGANCVVVFYVVVLTWNFKTLFFA